MKASVSGRLQVQLMPIDGADADRLHVSAAADRDPDRVAGLAPPQRLVELLLRADVDAVDADDVIAALEARRPGGAGLVEAVDDHASALGGRVEPEPRPRRAAQHATNRDQLVLDGEELLGGNRQADVRLVPEAERHDADDAAAL